MVTLGERHTQTASWAKGTYSKSPLSLTDRAELATYRFGNPQNVTSAAAEQVSGAGSPL